MHKLNSPKSEGELKETLDFLYTKSKEAKDNGKTTGFIGLLEVMSAEPTIVSAIHKIKSNKGSMTPGTDGWIIRNVLERDYDEIIAEVQSMFSSYVPHDIRRVYIPKPGREEKRPLGIVAIADRVIQECVRMVIEPILEAQFFKHSYGFRPMRDAHMALARLSNILHDTGYIWVVEGDIIKFFDNVNHSILLKQLWHLGIRDQRVLMIIKAMLRSGIMNECAVNKLGTPQGGIISPLLANAYLHKLDKWVSREWEEKKTRYPYSNQGHKIRAVKNNSNLKPAYWIRYADDWVLITNSWENAEKWKFRISRYLKEHLRLELSEEKSLITNVRAKNVNFLGFSAKRIRGKSRTGYITRVKPQDDRIKTKVKEIHKNIYNLRKQPDKQILVEEIFRINSQIRGLLNYYDAATQVNTTMQKYSDKLKYAAYKALKQHGAKWTPANRVDNLPTLHSEYNTQIPAIVYKDKLIGITLLIFCKFSKIKVRLANPNETPYSAIGRKIYMERTGKTLPLTRLDEVLGIHLVHYVRLSKAKPIYNFEYIMNRGYALLRDKGKCKICGTMVRPGDMHFHHISPKLALSIVNKVKNLATVHNYCHQKIHNSADYEVLGRKVWGKIQRFREKLNVS